MTCIYKLVNTSSCIFHWIEAFSDLDQYKPLTRHLKAKLTTNDEFSGGGNLDVRRRRRIGLVLVHVHHRLNRKWRPRVRSRSAGCHLVRTGGVASGRGWPVADRALLVPVQPWRANPLFEGSLAAALVELAAVGLVRREVLAARALGSVGHGKVDSRIKFLC